MTRTIITALACSVLMSAQPSATAVAGSYRFTALQQPQGLDEAVTVMRTVAGITDVSADTATATLTFSGPAAAVNFAEWLLPQFDRATGDNSVHEYRLPSGEIARVNFVANVSKPQEMQELLTILRTVADIPKIFTLTSNHAMVLRGAEWQVSFSEWIIAQLDQPTQQKPDTTPQEFTVGGPDFRGLGHRARVNFLAGMTSPRQMQELLTVLRTVSDVQKVFSYTGTHALVLRAGDTDLDRAEWIIQQLDLPAGASGPKIFTGAAGDDVTRIFYLSNTTPQWLRSAVDAMRSEVKIRKVFSTTSPANIVVRGTSDQIAAAMTWMTAHNALVE
jgi:hypothetical protein